jgi:SAM-dependent MidA family methyltransferase
MTERASLERRILDRIRAKGPMTFAAFMESALYDPDGGYYTASPVGEAGDFVTSPHVSQAFGVLLARCVEDLWLRLDRPEPFLLVEAGAGDGTLARRILASLPAELAATTTFVAVERSAGARRALVRLSREPHDPPQVGEVTVVDDLGLILEPGAPAARPARVRPEGVVLANELLDNLPFHRLLGTRDGVVELLVGLDGTGGGSLTPVHGPPSDELLALAPPLGPGQEAAVSPAMFGFLDGAAAALGRGYLLLIDYATGSDGTVQVHGYRRHRIEADVLDAPGSRDITAGVDIGALAGHARARGFAVWGPISQRAALTNLGFPDWDRELLTRQAAALNEGRGRDAARIYSARNRARLLVDPAGLGSFEVLCIGVGDPPRPDLLLDGGAVGSDGAGGTGKTGRTGRPEDGAGPTNEELPVDVADDEEHAAQHRDQVRDQHAR